MAAEAPTEPAPLDALAACSIDRWYPVLRRNSVRTTLVPLRNDVFESNLCDAIVRPWPQVASNKVGSGRLAPEQSSEHQLDGLRC